MSFEKQVQSLKGSQQHTHVVEKPLPVEIKIDSNSSMTLQEEIAALLSTVTDPQNTQLLNCKQVDTTELQYIARQGIALSGGRSGTRLEADNLTASQGTKIATCYC